MRIVATGERSPDQTILMHLARLTAMSLSRKKESLSNIAYKTQYDDSIHINREIIWILMW